MHSPHKVLSGALADSIVPFAPQWLFDTALARLLSHILHSLHNLSRPCGKAQSVVPFRHLRLARRKPAEKEVV